MSQNNPPKKGRFQRYEEIYIRENYRDMTWKEIAQHLNRPLRAVLEKADRMNLKKTGPNSYADDFDSTFAELSPEDRRKRILSDLENSADFNALIDSFTVEELARYKQKWIEILMSNESMTATEKDAAHVMISNLIRMDRYQKIEKHYYDQRELKINEDSKGNIIPPFTMHREFKEANENFIQAQKTLAMSREQRIKREGDDKISILNLISEFRDIKLREQMNKEAAAFKYFKDKSKSKMKDNDYIKGDM